MEWSWREKTKVEEVIFQSVSGIQISFPFLRLSTTLHVVRQRHQDSGSDSTPSPPPSTSCSDGINASPPSTPSPYSALTFGVEVSSCDG